MLMARNQKIVLQFCAVLLRFFKSAKNLYRLESSNGYYALLKRGSKQFRRALKAKDRRPTAD
jgi:hypothetical protein